VPASLSPARAESMMNNPDGRCAHVLLKQISNLIDPKSTKHRYMIKQQTPDVLQEHPEANKKRKSACLLLPTRQMLASSVLFRSKATRQ
jgi:hypothetical protein